MRAKVLQNALNSSQYPTLPKSWFGPNEYTVYVRITNQYGNYVTQQKFGPGLSIGGTHSDVTGSFSFLPAGAYWATLICKCIFDFGTAEIGEPAIPFLGAINVKISNQQSLTISSSASFTLNYLVFLQNVFINQQASPNEPLRFPYLNSSHWGLLDGAVFQERFKNTFEYVIEHFSSHQPRAKELILTNRQDELFRCLFEPSQIGMNGLEESFLSFITWWKHGAGGSFVSTRLNETSLEVIYNQLNAHVESASAGQCVLKIDLVYDEIRFSDETIRKNYVVLPIQEIEKLPYTKTLPDSALRKLLSGLNF